MICPDIEDCRTGGACLAGPDKLRDPGAFAPRYRVAIRLPHLVFWSCPLSFMSTPRCDHDHLSFTASPIPVTPPGSPDGGILVSFSNMFIPFCLVFRVFSSTLLPALHRPCLFGTARESATLCPSSLRDLLIDSVCCRLWQHQRQDRRASLGKTHHLPISRPASCQVGSPDIRLRLVTSARPPPQHHLAGSLFATYTGSASGFLQTPRFPGMPLPCWRRPSVR